VLVAGLKKHDHKELARYIRAIADEIALRDWTIDLQREPCDDDCNAQACLVYGRKLVRLRVSRDFRSYDLERVRHSVVHELVHCHTSATDNMVEHDLTDHLGQQAADIFHAGYRRHAEYAVDGLADALAPHVPLIEWPE
jgi:hypothetical protein